jgi:uncharacterized repeat protein (TIGR02543 family)
LKKLYYLFIFFIFIIGFNACSDNPSQTTINLTTETQTEQETENQTTDSPTTSPTITTDNQTTVTEVPTNNPTTNMPTTQATTNITTTIPTTVEPTTEAPTTVPTTEEPTTILVIEITLDDGLGGTYDILSGSPGDTIILPSDPTRTNYVFDGWYVDQAYTVPFVSTVFPSSDITVYAKWVAEVNPADLIMDALEADYDFVCNNNVCTLQENSWTTYTFNFNNLTFKVELIDDDNSDYQTKNELVIIDEDWNVDYSFSIQYLSNSASMTVSGDGSTDTYSVDSFSSNPSTYLTESNVYDDAVDFITDAVMFLEFIVADLEIDYNELN